jgi:anti-sigma B factor antagonist
MEVQLLEGDSYTTVYIIGEVDAYSSIEVQSTLQNLLLKGQKNIHINCENLEYISSAGLGAFMSLFEEIQNQNGQMVFSNMKPKVYNVFQLLGLDQIMTIVNNSQEAVTFFNN